MIQAIKKIIQNPKKYYPNAKTFFRYAKMAVKKAVPKFSLLEDVKKKIHHRNSVAFYKKIIKKDGALVFDVGANIGMKTEFFREAGARVVSVEPQPDYAAYLRVKFSNDKKVTVEQCGLGEAEGEETLHISSKYPGFSSFHEDWQAGTKYHAFDKTEKVKIRTIEYLIQKYGMPVFCKIDVEGFEPQVFSGLKSKIPMLNFEFHSNDPVLAKKCVEKLTQIGFTEFNFTEEENTFFTESEWLNPNELWSKIRALSEKKEAILWGDIYAR